jgi:hypothetical protein
MDDLEREYLNRHAAGKDPRNPTARADRWGNRVLISNNPALLGSGSGTVTPVQGQPPARDAAIIVKTREFLAPRQIAIGVRYAQNDPVTNEPILPFSSVYPDFGAVPNRRVLQFALRQSVDDLAAIITENIAAGPFPNEFPFDILSCRQLGITVTMPARDPVDTSFTSIWVEVIASLVDELADRNRIVGWGRNINVGGGTFPPFIAAAAIGVPVPLLAANPGRTQFFIVNTSTNADLLVSFGDTASWGPPIVGSVVLPRGQFATYESPVGGFSGGVTGMWNAAAPDGGAIVTQGAQ